MFEKLISWPFFLIIIRTDFIFITVSFVFFKKEDQDLTEVCFKPKPVTLPGQNSIEYWEFVHVSFVASRDDHLTFTNMCFSIQWRDRSKFVFTPVGRNGPSGHRGRDLSFRVDTIMDWPALWQTPHPPKRWDWTTRPIPPGFQWWWRRAIFLSQAAKWGSVTAL